MNELENMEASDKLQDKIEALSKLLVKSFSYVEEDPDSFLLNARKTTETILKFIYNKEVGVESGRKMMLNDYGRELLSKKIIPERIGIVLGTIQTYGNYGAHAQDDYTETSKEWVGPCQTALANLSNWFFLDYLQGEIPNEIIGEMQTLNKTGVGKNNQNIKLKKVLLIVIPLMLVTIGISLFVVFQTKKYNEERNFVEGNSITNPNLENADILEETTGEIIEKSPNAKRIAILYFDNNSEDKTLQALAKGLADMMITDLSKYNMLQVVERNRLDDILREQKLSQTKDFDKTTAVKIGKLLGVEAILVGAYFEMIGQLRIDARLINVETGEVIKSEGVNGSSESFFSLEKELVGKLLVGMELELKEWEKELLNSSVGYKLSVNAGLRFSKGLNYLDKGQKDSALVILKNMLEEYPGFEPAENAVSELEI